MEYKNSFLQEFSDYLIGIRKELDIQIKEYGNIKDNSEKYYLQKYKALLLKKTQINYFLSCLSNDKYINDEHLFVSYKVLSDYIFDAPLSVEDKFETFLYYLNINAASIDSSNATPYYESVFDNYNLLINKPIHVIRSLSNPEKIKEVINDDNICYEYYSKICNSFGIVYKINIRNVLSKISNGYSNLDYFMIDSILEYGEFLGINKKLLFEFEKFIYKKTSIVRDIGDNYLEYFEDNADWFKDSASLLNIIDKYNDMLALAMNFISEQSDLKYKYICQLHAEMGYIIDSMKHNLGGEENIPYRIKKFQKSLK